MTQAALPHLKTGDAIVNTTSVTAYRGHKTLVDYASTKGAIVSFTRSLSQQLAARESGSMQWLQVRFGRLSFRRASMRRTSWAKRFAWPGGATE
jgi:NAD(P)-dependent dehydrogenase (short-subunit alcohol dehydrogenase family)